MKLFTSISEPLSRICSTSSAKLRKPDNSRSGVQVGIRYREFMSVFTECLSASRAFSCSSFHDCIFHVVIVGTKKQVVRVNTSWNVAPMQDGKAVWNWPIVQLPRESVGSRQSSGCTNRCASRNELTISTGHSRCSPQPAGVSFFDLRPKGFNRINAGSDSMALSGTVFSMSGRFC